LAKDGVEMLLLGQLAKDGIEMLLLGRLAKMERKCRFSAD
jgi:hypothetical protein